jgi:hypothetical protein
MPRAVTAVAAGWVLALHPVLDALQAPVFVVVGPFSVPAIATPAVRHAPRPPSLA